MRVCRSALWALYTAMTMKEPCVDFMLMEAETVTIQMGGAPYIYKCMTTQELVWNKLKMETGL